MRKEYIEKFFAKKKNNKVTNTNSNILDVVAFYTVSKIIKNILKVIGIVLSPVGK